jgi:hypothetical protein
MRRRDCSGITRGAIIMLACEFQAIANNGFIKIPDEYKSFISRNLKVILLSEGTAGKKTNKSFFPYFAVDTTNYVFNREEANER